MTTGRGPKVLYVDDEESNLVTFKYCFADYFDVLVARSGHEALELMATEPVAVLLADQRMPGLTGVELCAAARARHPEVVRMIVTAYADLQATVEAINSGAVARYIMKPWTEERMRTELQNGLRAYELAQLIRESHARLLRADQQTDVAVALCRQVHELVNPLVALSSSLRLARDLARELMTALGPLAARGTAQDLEEAISAGLRVADELVGRLELFQHGDEAGTDEGAVTDVNQAVEAALAIVGPQLRTRATLILQLGDVPAIAAAPTRVCQIVANLLTNAVEAIDSGRPGQDRITVTTRRQGPHVTVEVRDTGRGLTPDAVERMFEPFVTTKEREGPRGLGLAVVRDHVRRLRGEVRVTTQPGQGTSVVVQLPTVEPGQPGH